MTSLGESKVAIIGAGIIGGAIAESLNGKCVVTATRRRVEKLESLKDKGISVTDNNQMAADWADVIILTVKSKQVVPVLREIAHVASEKLIISFAAAISIDIMEKALPKARFIRAMTNTPVLIRQGYTVYSLGNGVTEEEAHFVERVFQNLGTAQQVEEQYLDALTAMSGSGPAYIYTVVEAMIYGALKVGLPRDLAQQAAAYTAIGASQLLLKSGRHIAELKDMVVTPGGVTIEGIYELEESRIRTAFMKGISAASAKAEELAEAAREQAEKQIKS